jgi:hypothetical protein
MNILRRSGEESNLAGRTAESSSRNDALFARNRKGQANQVRLVDRFGVVALMFCRR